MKRTGSNKIIDASKPLRAAVRGDEAPRDGDARVGEPGCKAMRELALLESMVFMSSWRKSVHLVVGLKATLDYPMCDWMAVGGPGALAA